MRALLVVLGLFLPAAGSLAQVAPLDTSKVILDTLAVDTTGPKIDTILYLPPEDRLPLENVTDTTALEGRLVQRPTTALFKSMILPGWGQIGNRRYKKALFFIGLQTWFAGASIHYGRQAGEFKDSYDQSLDTDERNTWYSLYLDRRDERNKYLWFFGITTFISMFDAYVDAHLSGSPFIGDEDKSGVKVGMNPGSGEVRALFCLHF